MNAPHLSLSSRLAKRVRQHSQGKRISRRWLVTVSLCLLVFSALPAAHADGLVFQLPEGDGTLAVFSVTSDATMQLQLSEKIDVSLLDDSTKAMLARQEMKLNREVSVATVGKETVSQQPCRWLQYQVRDGESPSPPVTLETLVPKNLCVRGKDPLMGSIKTFFNWKDADRANGAIVQPPGFDRIRYELERLRPIFPPPLTNERELAREDVETPVKTFSGCRVVTGTTNFAGALLADGLWDFSSTFTIWLHEEAPFGVVKMRCQSEGRELSEESTVLSTNDTTMILSRVESGAQRILPEVQKAKNP